MKPLIGARTLVSRYLINATRPSRSRRCATKWRMPHTRDDRRLLRWRDELTIQDFHEVAGGQKKDGAFESRLRTGFFKKPSKKHRCDRGAAPDRRLRHSTAFPAPGAVLGTVRDTTKGGLARSHKRA